jgi:hypothetical protein
MPTRSRRTKAIKRKQRHSCASCSPICLCSHWRPCGDHYFRRAWHWRRACDLRGRSPEHRKPVRQGQDGSRDSPCQPARRFPRRSGRQGGGAARANSPRPICNISTGRRRRRSSRITSTAQSTRRLRQSTRKISPMCVCSRSRTSLAAGKRCSKSTSPMAVFSISST